jgi:nucleolysin TIA-1/TIAR
LDYSDVWGRASDTNTTVYCGGISNLTDDHVRQIFGIYGQITGIHPFPDRGYSFVRFTSKESACAAICGVHGMEINGNVAKCSWGKENTDMSSGGSSSSNNTNSNVNSMQYNNANSVATAAAALAAMQANPLQVKLNF